MITAFSQPERTANEINMSSLVHMVVENYNELLESKNGNPIVDSWLFMKSPIPVITIVIFYLYFVLKLGPKLMEKRPAFELKHVMVIYNAYQVLFNMWLASHAFNIGNALTHLFKHSCFNPSLDPDFQLVIITTAWWFFFSKIVDILDTIFFVLRKKQSQVTFLHVYHHTIMVLFTWGYLKFAPGEQGLFVGFLNTIVHIIMYSYYLIAALGPKFQKYLWWKKYMTWIQLAQFCIMLTYLSFIIIMDCQLPKSLTFFLGGNVVIFLYLFSDFYRKAYNKPKSDHMKKAQ